MTVLTILIPTFNRAADLRKLLDQLSIETNGLEDLVSVKIFDNHSIDNTFAIAKNYTSTRGSWLLVRNHSNIGADRNFLLAISSVNSPYFWMIGDDDLPRSGFLRLLVDLLQQRKPDLVYLNSIGKPVVSAADLPKIHGLVATQKDAETFAKDINIFTTFISAWIVNYQVLCNVGVCSTTLSKGIGSFLIQLGWIFPLIRRDSVLLEISDPCILATNGDCWGGFRFLEVFCINYPKAVNSYFTRDRALRQALIRSYIENGMPQRIRGLRNGIFGKGFNQESLIFVRCVALLGGYKSFWTCVLPSFFPCVDVVLVPLLRLFTRLRLR